MHDDVTVDYRGVRTKRGRPTRDGYGYDMLQQCQKCPRWVYTTHEHEDRYLCGTCASQEINKELEAKRKKH